MGFSYHKTDDDYFITIDGKPFTDFDPHDVAQLIASLPKEEKELIEATIKQRLFDKYEEMTGIPLPDDYAKDYGRPSLKEVPYMKSENDGLPYLGGGHSPQCNGRKEYKKHYTDRAPSVCWCEWIGYYPDGKGKAPWK
jgi:hypothetical protein